jgi:hypothetical protein
VTQTLGLNDVAMLVPLPQNNSVVLLRAADAGDDGTVLVPRSLYDTLNTIPDRGPTLVEDVYPDLQVLAVRFDLCDRVAPGPCPDSDGRLRIVFQALRKTTPQSTVDAAFHAFYRIPNADLPALVAELRALSRLQNAPLASPLGVSPALSMSTTGDYAVGLKRLITKYAGTNSLLRLTFFAQPDIFAAVRWVFRGVEKSDAAFTEIVIPGIAAGLQEVTFLATNSFEVAPVVDQPKGFVLATSEMAFAAASPADRQVALQALAAAENPLTHTPKTIQCATCHVSSHIQADRASASGLDPRNIAGRYTSSSFDLTVPPIAERTLRALGWLQGTPLIAQRTANESAQVALEMDARFPP